ncbi:uncharacterized protein LOC108669009 [Hyalella azteca]|uniref:Uncharacterized protein LOC108669009 n=1 Tax=Hyalella azteca TaxID=294128 RepID=A0A8B7NDV6_HYAAZ|nr:uncharacterized protein LOC108669009 [Hyalella azteca]
MQAPGSILQMQVPGSLQTQAPGSLQMESRCSSQVHVLCSSPIPAEQCVHNDVLAPAKETLPRRAQRPAAKEQHPTPPPHKNCQSIAVLGNSRLRVGTQLRMSHHPHDGTKCSNYQDDVIAPAEEFQDPQPARSEESESSL